MGLKMLDNISPEKFNFSKRQTKYCNFFYAQIHFLNLSAGFSRGQHLSFALYKILI